MQHAFTLTFLALPLLSAARHAAQDDERLFRPLDVFQLEQAVDPQVSPDGASVVYVRASMDVMRDRVRRVLWLVSADGRTHRPLTDGGSEGAPRFSPDGGRLAYVADSDAGAQLFVRWMDSGQTARLSQLPAAPGALAWSPDGRQLAFTMAVRAETRPFAELPPAPEGAEWAEPPKVITKLRYRADGEGYLKDAFEHVFVIPAEGGTPRQLTFGAFDDAGPLAWAPDQRALVFSSNRRDDADWVPLDSDLWAVRLDGGELEQLTRRFGPDHDPTLAPDGRTLAWLGFEDRFQGYQTTELFVMERGGAPRSLTAELDRTVEAPVWAPDGSGLFYLYDDGGTSRIGFVTLAGERRVVASDVGGLSLGRPYSGGAFSVAGGRIAFTAATTARPSDVAVVAATGGGRATRLTSLNDDLFAHKELGAVEELTVRSSFDQRPVQGWLVRPPGFDPARRYPLILEIHGGPFANYGARFAAEIQLYAAAGYVVLYTNPRGSTGYGAEFGNLIHHDYPGHDYEDLMSCVDAVLAMGFVDPESLFVTGGSGGGVLSAWIVGRTDRFRAAVVAKPVINWTSFALTSDAYAFFYRYWFPGPPWERQEEYWRRSPLSLVGNVRTPTMLLTGEVDYRTPISESEQYYQALKLRRVDTALVRIPGASHGIAARPSQLIAKVAHVLRWFELYGKDAGSARASEASASGAGG